MIVKCYENIFEVAETLQNGKERRCKKLGLIGKDNRVWGFYGSMQDAEKALNQQNDPEWYRIEEVWMDDYFDLEAGRLVNQRYVG